MRRFLGKIRSISHKKQRNKESLRRFLTGQAFFPVPALPWRVSADLFVSQCTKSQCYKCINACPEKVLVPSLQGYPSISFKKNGCSFCGDCVRVCPSNLFALKETTPWQLKVNLSTEACVAFEDIHCRNCEEACPEKAISIFIRKDGCLVPKIELSKCTGCGKCIASCFSKALSITSLDKEFFLL